MCVDVCRCVLWLVVGCGWWIETVERRRLRLTFCRAGADWTLSGLWVVVAGPLGMVGMVGMAPALGWNRATGAGYCTVLGRSSVTSDSLMYNSRVLLYTWKWLIYCKVKYACDDTSIVHVLLWLCDLCAKGCISLSLPCFSLKEYFNGDFTLVLLCMPTSIPPA